MNQDELRAPYFVPCALFFPDAYSEPDQSRGIKLPVDFFVKSGFYNNIKFDRAVEKKHNTSVK